MYSFKAFANVRTLVSNTLGVIAPIGELSPNSSTFARDTKIFSGSNPDVFLTGFSSKSNLNGQIAPPSTILDKSIEISEWVVTRQKNSVTGESKADFLIALIAFFGTTCDRMTCGEMITGVNGKNYPSFISWYSREYQSEDNQNTIWFADAAFARQYDEYEIVVVPPIDQLDLFYGSYLDVLKVLASSGYSQQISKIQAARSTYPETILTTDTYTYYSYTDSGKTIDTNWTYLIYGPKGNDADLIRQALIGFILKNTAKTIDYWKKIFPDIFKITEFMIIPQWEKYSVDEMTVTEGVHSPVLNYTRVIEKIKTLLMDYRPVYIDRALCGMTHPYKSLALSMVGNEDNRGGKQYITDVYPDLMMVSTSSNDFKRMSLTTRQFLTLLAEMLLVAEKLTSESDIDLKFKKTVRNDILYLSVNYNNIAFHVASKASIMAKSV